jgi:hypothetical protein
MKRLWIAVVLVPLYLLMVRLTSGSALIGFRRSEQVWTIEYLVPAVVAFALAVWAWTAKPSSRTGRIVRAIGIALNLALFVLLAAGNVMLWGDHM